MKKSETLIAALITAGTLFLTKIMLDDMILRTKKDELERRLEDAMRNYEGDSRKLTEKEKDEVNKEYDSLCARLVKSSYNSQVRKSDQGKYVENGYYDKMVKLFQDPELRREDIIKYF